MSSDTKYLVSLFHTPSGASRRVFYGVVRAGWLQAAPDYRIERMCCSGHDILLCLAGAGFVRCHGRTHAAEEGSLIWINGYHPHAHWADPQRPWELYWLRIDAPWLEATGELLAVDRYPVITQVDRPRLTQIYERLFDLMTHRPLAMEAIVHAEIARLIAHVFEVRQAGSMDEDGGDGGRIPNELLEPIRQMTLYPHRDWRLADLARMGRVSVPAFCRRFRQAFHASPIDWLRRERITRAKRRLLESADSIKEIAFQVGYRDPFFFSRDFKRYSGLTPTAFRSQEKHAE
jgi:AraC-like DNA-binding protein